MSLQTQVDFWCVRDLGTNASDSGESLMMDYYLVVLGKTGSGKSWVCNQLLGRQGSDNPFRVYNGMDGWTTEVQCVSSSKGNHRLHVIDTPDVFSLGEDDAGAKLMFEDWERLIVPRGLTAIIFTVRLDVRFTPNDYQLYKRYRELLPEPLKNNVILGFTRVDNLLGPVEDQIILSSVQTLLSDCKGRYVTFRAPSDGQIVDKIIGWITETDTGGSRDTGEPAPWWSGVWASIGRVLPTGLFNRFRTV